MIYQSVPASLDVFLSMKGLLKICEIWLTDNHTCLTFYERQSDIALTSVGICPSCQMYLLNWQMYLFKLPNVFVQTMFSGKKDVYNFIDWWSCMLHSGWEAVTHAYIRRYLSKLSNVFAKLTNVFVQIAKWICSNNVFWEKRCIQFDWLMIMHASLWMRGSHTCLYPSVFVQIVKCIC